MTICDLNTGAGRLMRSTKRLKEAWAEVQQNWNDPASRKFAERYLEPMGPQLQLTLAAIGEMVELFENAERECRDNWFES